MDNNTDLIESTAETIEKTTHFGYQRVKHQDKRHKVAKVFDSVASKRT